MASVELQLFILYVKVRIPELFLLFIIDLKGAYVMGCNSDSIASTICEALLRGFNFKYVLFTARIAMLKVTPPS